MFGPLLKAGLSRPLNCLFLATGKCLWSTSLGSLPRHAVWINYQESQHLLPFNWHKLCVLWSSPNSTLDGNFTLGKLGWSYAFWLLRSAPGRVSTLDLGLGLLDLRKSSCWVSSTSSWADIWPGHSGGSMSSPGRSPDLKMGIRPDGNIHQTF